MMLMPVINKESSRVSDVSGKGSQSLEAAREQIESDQTASTSTWIFQAFSQQRSLKYRVFDVRTVLNLFLRISEKARIIGSKSYTISSNLNCTSLIVRNHIAQDLLPYVCPFEDCQIPEIWYASAEAWMSHIRQDHTRLTDWRCPACEKTATSSSDFILHVQEKHEDIIDDDLLYEFADRCRQPELTIVACPICGDKDECSLDLIGEHIHAFSMRSLLWPATELPPDRSGTFGLFRDEQYSATQSVSTSPGRVQSDDSKISKNAEYIVDTRKPEGTMAEIQRTDVAVDPNTFVEDIRTELMRVTQNEDSSQDAFIVHSDLEAIWFRSRVHTLLKLCCLCPENTIDQVADIIIDHYLKTISILIHIPWMQWPRFTEVFLGNATTWEEARIVGRNDDNLPYNLQDLRVFLGNYARGFDFHQWLFLPVRIGERRSASLADYTEDHRLPVLKTEPLGRGASGVIYRETIAPGCLALGSGSWNAESIEVARKHIETQEDFDSESVVIERLKNNRLRHRHITRCYGVVFRQGLLQSKLDIFYELASSNLSQFLTNWGESQPTSEIQRHVLTQTFSLIDALVLCHEQFYDPEQGHVILAHNDLKPENILVFDNDAESLVGTWKIADFGLSKIKQVVEDSTFLSPQDLINHDLSLSKAIRPPGGYTVPEIVRRGSLLENSSSVQGDIWSLGCILAQILVFTVGGSQALKRFNHLRLPGNTFNYRDDRYFESYPGLGQLRLKRPLFEVLIELCDSSSENNWVKQLVDLVLDVLMVDKDPNGDGKILLGARPKASTIRDRFREIQRSHRSQA
ncbi:hypothetical protein D6D17_09827, partial [Aureobasidium pullulans]